MGQKSRIENLGIHRCKLERAGTTEERCGKSVTSKNCLLPNFFQEISAFQATIHEQIAAASTKLVENVDNVLDYEKFVDVVISPSLALINAICTACGSSKQDSIMVSLVRIAEAHQKTIPLIKTIISREVENTGTNE